MGGLVGYAINLTLQNCYQLGIAWDPNAAIVDSCGGFNIGGLLGFCEGCTITQCGVEQGQIKGYCGAGGIAGDFSSPIFISEVYVTSSVSIKLSREPGGGIVSSFKGKDNFIQNSYTAASLSGASIGGFVGFLCGSPQFAIDHCKQFILEKSHNFLILFISKLTLQPILFQPTIQEATLLELALTVVLWFPMRLMFSTSTLLVLLIRYLLTLVPAATVFLLLVFQTSILFRIKSSEHLTSASGMDTD